MYSITHFHAIIVEFQRMFVNMMSKADGLSECDREEEEDGRGECGRRGFHLRRRPLRGLAPAGRDSRFILTRISCLNCALQDDEAVYWVSIGHCEAEAVGD